MFNVDVNFVFSSEGAEENFFATFIGTYVTSCDVTQTCSGDK